MYSECFHAGPDIVEPFCPLTKLDDANSTVAVRDFMLDELILSAQHNDKIMKDRLPAKLTSSSYTLKWVIPTLYSHDFGTLDGEQGGECSAGLATTSKAKQRARKMLAGKL